MTTLIMLFVCFMREQYVLWPVCEKYNASDSRERGEKRLEIFQLPHKYTPFIYAQWIEMMMVNK